MPKYIHTLTLAVAIVIAGTLVGRAAGSGPDPRAIAYEGYLEDGGTPVTGTLPMAFSLYGTASGGSLVWTERQSAVEVAGGKFSVVLGSVAALGDAVWQQPRLFLEITVNDQAQPLSGRQELLPAAYAVRSVPGAKFDLTGASSYLDFGSNTRQMVSLWGGGANAPYGIGVQGNTAYFRSSKNFAFYQGGTHSDAELSAGTGGSAAMVISNGSVGIGTTAPASALDVNGGLRATSGGQLNAIAVGNAAPGYAASYAYETIALPPTNNLRINFGSAEKYLLQNNGNMTISGKATVGGLAFSYSPEEVDCSTYNLWPNDRVCYTTAPRAFCAITYIVHATNATGRMWGCSVHPNGDGRWYVDAFSSSASNEMQCIATCF